MKYSKWYSSDIKTSALGFGCMRFSTNDGIVDKDKAISLVRKAYENGVNYFDTAYVYLDKQSEPVLGEAISIYPRSSYYLATKYSFWNLTDQKEIEKMIDIQLGNLKTDYIDFYLLHALNANRLEHMKKYHILDTVKKWKEQGKIKHIGFSFHDNYETFMEILNYYYDWEFCQIQFNYMDYDIQQGKKGYEELVKREIPIIVMEPLKGGKLCAFNPTIAQKFYDYNNDSLTKWALRWVMSQKGIMTFLSGMNEMSQLDENLEIASNFVPLSEEEEKIIKDVSDSLRKIEVVGCTSCKYCMPCPKGVNIPRNLKLLNDYEMYRSIGDVKWQYQMLKWDNAQASKCVNCKTCVSKCPQHILIPDYLVKVRELVDDCKQD